MIRAMPRIAIDCRFAATRSGIGRYTRELVSAMLRQPSAEIEFVLIMHSADGDWLPQDASGIRLARCDAAHYSLAEQRDLPAVLVESKADLLFTPHFNVPLRLPVPFVVTIHDLILHAYPNQASFLKQMAYRALMRHAVRKSSAIITVSKFVESELKIAYGDAIATKTHRITEGVDPSFHPRGDQEVKALRQRYVLPRPFFLYVGNAKQHKNVGCLLDAWRQLGSTEKELVLVAGGSEAKLVRLPEGARLMSDIADDDLPALYSAAEAFVTASLYEGFCLPVAEAAACGCPVIASNRAAIPEVAPHGSMLIEPTPEAFGAALANPPSSRKPAPPRTWEEPARKTMEVLLRSLNRR